MVQRLVVVDDTNSNIQYSGPWFAAQNTQLNTGNFGPPFQNTLHGVNVDASFSFSFSGSSITVLGTSITTNSSGSQDPTWECFIDNNSIGWNTVLQFAENSWIFCQNGQLQDGPHVLNVKAKVAHQNTFWFDQIQYNPSSSASLDQSMLRYESSDSAMQYSSGWQVYDGIAGLTQTAGSTLTFVFSGVSLSAVCFLPGRFPLTSSSATYSIDGQTPTNFLVPGLSSSGTMELYNQVLFQTGQLSAGQHKLVITHQGNSGQAPLAVEYFLVQNAPSSSTSSSNGNSNGNINSQSLSSGGSTISVKGTATNTIPSGIPSGSTVSVSSDIPTGTPGATSISSGVPSSSSSNSALNAGSTSSESTARTVPLGPIIGGVLGGIILLLLLLILFLFIRRRNNQGTQRLTDKSYATDMVDPFNVPPQPTSSPYHIPEGQSPSPLLITNKAAQERRFADMPNTFNNMRTASPSADSSSSASGAARLIPLRNYSTSDSPSLVPPSPPVASPSSGLPLSANLMDGKAREAEMDHPQVSQQVGEARVLRHEDSGVRMPPADTNVVELPPMYTPG